MDAQSALRKYIRSVLEESVNNFLDKEEATETNQLKDDSKPEVLGDPLFDIELNQMADNLGSDGDNLPTVSVVVGKIKGGNKPNAGQHQAVFSDKTEIATAVKDISQTL